MDQGFRLGFTAAEKTELRDRWRRAESLKAIGRSLHRRSIFWWLRMADFVLPSGVAPDLH